MKVFNVKITETLERQLAIPAKTAEEAELIANTMYEAEKVVLTADDFTDKTIAADCENVRSVPDIVDGAINLLPYNTEQVMGCADTWVKCKVNLKTKEVTGFTLDNVRRDGPLLLWVFDIMCDVYGEDMANSGQFWSKDIKGKKKIC